MKYDQLDQLFLPLLTAAQKANDILGVRTGGPESALNAAAHLAGELLRDVSFTPIRSLSVNAANAYLIDFAEIPSRWKPVSAPGMTTARRCFG